MSIGSYVKTVVGLGLACGLLGGCASGGGGGGGGGGLQDSETFTVETGAAGTVEVAAGTEAQSDGPAELGGTAPANTTSGTVTVSADDVTFGNGTGEGAQADITVHIAPADAETPCDQQFAVLSFTATLGADGAATLDGASQALSEGALDVVVADNFVLCFQIVADFTGTVTVAAVDIELTGDPDSDNDNTGGNDNVDPFDFFTCTSPNGEDDLVEFGDPGTTQVTLSTLGEGRHMLLDDNWDLVYEFDQPVRFCAVIPEHFALTDSSTGSEIPIPEANLIHQHLADNAGVVVRSRVTIVLPDGLQTGQDYELTLSATGLSLDGEFQVNPGTDLAANGTLPSGDGSRGGDFVQSFRAVGVNDYLTGTPAAGGITLDDQGQLYMVGEAGLYGPFAAPGVVTEESRLGADLPTLSGRNVVVTEDGTVIVKGRADGTLFEVDPTTGNAAEVARGARLESFPKSSVRAPAGYNSIELAGVQEGDVIFGGDGGVSVPDLANATGLKGDLRLVVRTGISSAWVNMWTPPARDGWPGSIYAGHKPEESDGGFQIRRILPNGIVDDFVIPRSLFGFEGSSTTHLQDIQGRREFMLLGDLSDNALLDTRQLVPAGFDGVGVYIFDAARNRMQLVTPMALKTFAFDFSAFSQVMLTDDFERAYISLPLENKIVTLDGLANSNADGDWPCDDIYDLGVEFTDSDARVVASSFGLGGYLLAGAPTVVEFEFDRPLPFCAFNADNVSLVDLDDPSGAQIAIQDSDVKRIPIYDGGQMLACRMMIDLPPSLVAGHDYQLTLSGDGLGMDGEFNGALPSGDNSPGGDFVQTFRLIEGSRFLTETRNSTGIAIDQQGRLFVSNEDQVYGPFAAATDVTEANALGTVPMLPGGGRPLTVDAGGQVIAAGRNNGTLQSIDPETGLVTSIGSSVGGTFEINVIAAPPGFDGDVVSAGDLIVCSEGRGTVANLLSGNGATTLFNDPDVSSGYTNYFVTPPDLFGPQLLYGGYDDVTNGFTMRQITPAGEQMDNVLPQPLQGVEGKGGIRLPDSGGSAEFLILADFDQENSPSLPTGQLRGSTSGLELLVYNVADNQLQVLGALSRGEESAPETLSVDADPDFAFTDDLSKIYLTQPLARTVVEISGWGGK